MKQNGNAVNQPEDHYGHGKKKKDSARNLFDVLMRGKKESLFAHIRFLISVQVYEDKHACFCLLTTLINPCPVKESRKKHGPVVPVFYSYEY